MNRFIYLLVPVLVLLVASCAGLKLDPPGADKQAILVLPVRVTNTTERSSRHGFYYIYQIVSDPDETVNLNSRVTPYEAIFRLPIKGDMLIVDSLPPGSYMVDKFIFKTVGAGDFTYGRNVFTRNDRFKLEAGKITIFSKSLKVSLYNKIPGRGSETSYSFNIVPVYLDQKEEILTTLRELPNFDKWKVMDM